MRTEAKINDWVDLIAARNAKNAEAWTARFMIDRFWLVEPAKEQLDVFGATIAPDTSPLEYLVIFPGSAVSEVVEILAVDLGAWLCARQTPDLE